MALINVAIDFGYEYFSFVIYFSKFFFVKPFFQHFFPKFFFKNLFFKGFTPDALPFTETKRILCIFVMKNMIYSKRSKLDFSLVQ